MSPEENKAIVRRYIEEIWNKKNYALSDEFIAPGCLINGNPLGGPEGGNRWAMEWHTYFPDQQKTFEQIVAEGDLVAVHFTERGTHRAELYGVAPTGKRIAWRVLAIFQLAGGKIVDIVAVGDGLDLQEKLRAPFATSTSAD